jgi:CRISPR/Cas system-associated endonuclease Cas1
MCDINEIINRFIEATNNYKPPKKWFSLTIKKGKRKKRAHKKYLKKSGVGAYLKEVETRMHESIDLEELNKKVAEELAQQLQGDHIG